jgi:tRNA(Ile)-lysidine synthase
MPPANAPLLEHVRDSLARFRMIPEGAPILVACSGGPDSVALLHVLHALGYSLEVGHLDHQTRDGASEADADFVRALAETLGLPYHEESRPIKLEAEESDDSFEVVARDARYAFFREVAEERELGVVATGHHSDDQAETVLMRLLRGTTPTGLSGIPPVRDEDGLRIVRPLITASRAQVMAYLETEGHEYRVDDSNADPRFLRNRVRNELLPLLESDYNPRLRHGLTRLAEVQRGENEVLEQVSGLYALEFMTPDQSAVNVEAFANGFTGVQRRVILHWAHALGVDCPFERVEAARAFILHAPAGKLFDLGDGYTLRKTRGVVELHAEAPPKDESEIALALPGETPAFGKLYRVRLLDSLPSDDLASYCTPTRQVFDAEQLGVPLTVRHRRDGDRMQPLGMDGTKKLKDYFIDAGVPAHERDAQPLLIGGDRIAWVVGHSIAAHAAVTPLTESYVEVEVCDAAE